MVKQKILWCCSECGHTQLKWTGSCSTCQKWNTFVQEVELPETQKRFTASAAASKPQKIEEISQISFSRHLTQMAELDRLLGGGIVKGSLLLIGGDPGIGKSTLMLQVSLMLAKQGLVVLYVCAEESIEQTSLRAKRLGISKESLYLFSETSFSHIKLQIQELKPDVLIVDSIQILYKSEIPSPPGSLTQVRELALEFMHLAKSGQMATFLVGHVTKSGEIAGPKVLEHIVDTVLEFEGDRQMGFRMLRAVKNRFGPTDELALFQMQSSGLSEITNPSQLFLEERIRETPGSVVISTVEGSRPLLVEVQALVASSVYANCARKSTGLDPNRLALLLAVLEKRMGYPLHRCDVFVSVAGGLRITEPAVDLGILFAISSSFCNQAFDQKTVCIGEVGLGGELRSVSRIEVRIKEAIHLGFERCILPQRNLASLPKTLKEKIELKGFDYVEDALRAFIR